jgi:tetratricopeptide (TPR) repeat protein
MGRVHIHLISLVAMLGAAQAQMSVSTFGATDARLCYEQAAEAVVASTENCDEALRETGMTKRDRMATLVNRGIILNRTGRYDDALADFGAALDRDSTLAEAYLNRGNTYFLMRRFDDAIADYETSLDNNLGKAHVAWYNIGLAYEAKKDAVKAREAFRTSLSIAPDFAPAQAKLGPPAAPSPD